MAKLVILLVEVLVFYIVYVRGILDGHYYIFLMI